MMTMLSFHLTLSNIFTLSLQRTTNFRQHLEIKQFLIMAR